MQSFKEYNSYHKFVVIFIATLIIIAFVHGLRMINGGANTITRTVTLDHAAKDIWPYLQNPELRDNWVINLTDTARLSGDPSEVNSVRILFWKEGYKKWNTDETTLNIVPENLYATYINGVLYEQNWEVRLESLRDCQTKVTYSITTRHKEYLDRYLAPFSASEEEKKMDDSLKSLNYWAGQKSTCAK